jgi:serine/threonine-protein kinase
MIPTFNPGSIIDDRFELLEPIGEGGMGSIWQAREQATGRKIALKLVRATRGGELHARFRREVDVIRRFSHPNVVAVLDAGELPDGLLFLAMELLHGSPLSNHLKGRPLPPSEILPVVAEACRGLEAAHAVGVVHRDVKPENIFLAIVEGAGVVPKLLDFGLSTAGDGRVQPRISASGQVLGTPAYMSPEQAMASPMLGPASDVWSVGVLLFEAVSGKLPFGGTNAGTQLDAILRDEPARLPSEVDGFTRSIIARCLKKDPRQRYPDAGALREDLERAMDALTHRALPIVNIDVAPESAPSTRGALSDPARVAAEPPITRAGRDQRVPLRGRSSILIAPFALALCAFALWRAKRPHQVPLHAEVGVAQTARVRAAAVVRKLPRPAPASEPRGKP